MLPPWHSYELCLTPPDSRHSLRRSQENPPSLHCGKCALPLLVAILTFGQLEYNINALSRKWLLFQHPSLVCIFKRYARVFTTSLSSPEPVERASTPMPVS